MRRRYIYDPVRKELVETAARKSDALHFIQPDLPGYESPIDGRWIEGRRARREDFKRTGCRPYEGFAQEKKEADKIVAERERKLDQLAEKMAHRGWDQATESVRRALRGR